MSTWGRDGGIIVATPGSDDIFIGLDDDSLLDFSFADNAIELDLDASDVTQTVDADDNTVTLRDFFGFSLTGSAFDDEVFVKVGDGDRVIKGGDGNDRIIIDAGGLGVTFDGTTLTSATGGSITLVEFEDIDVFNFPPTFIDDSDTTGFSDTGFFDSNPSFPQGFNDGVKFSGADSGNTATWTFSDLPPGSYHVSATWTNAPDRASNSAFTIFDGLTGETTASQSAVNQERAPNDFEDAGLSWSGLGIVDITGTNLTVQLTDVGANEFVVADAIRIEPVTPDTILIDDGDPGFSNGTGTRVEGFGQFGDQEIFPSGAGDDVATWTFSDLPVGTYAVSATWFAGAGSATDAPFRIDTSTDSQTIQVNQLLPPDDSVIGRVSWEELGEIHVGDGSLTVTLDDGANGNVIADAVRVDPAPVIRVYNVGDLVSPIPTGGNVNFGEVPRDSTSGVANSIAPIVIRNEGIAPLPLTGLIPEPTNGFTVTTPVVDVIPPNGEVKVDLEFSGSSLGTFGSTFDIADLFGVNLEVTVIDDDVPPVVEITSPVDGGNVVEGATISIAIDATDDVAVERVELLVDGQSSGIQPDMASPFVFDFTLPLLDDPQTPESDAITFTATTVDQAGNSATSAPVTVNLTPADSPGSDRLSVKSGYGALC